MCMLGHEATHRSRIASFGITRHIYDDGELWLATVAQAVDDLLDGEQRDENAAQGYRGVERGDRRQ